MLYYFLSQFLLPHQNFFHKKKLTNLKDEKDKYLNKELTLL